MLNLAQRDRNVETSAKKEHMTQRAESALSREEPEAQMVQQTHYPATDRTKLTAARLLRVLTMQC